jgi:hypothetical protein
MIRAKVVGRYVDASVCQRNRYGSSDAETCTSDNRVFFGQWFQLAVCFDRTAG